VGIRKNQATKTAYYGHMVRTHDSHEWLNWPRWPVTYRDGLPAHRRSPIQVLTQQCMAGS